MRQRDGPVTPEIVPRWEWRRFGDELSLRDTSALLTPGSVQESDEVYVLSPNGVSVKLRDELVDVKVLEQVNEEGLEQWRPILKATPPLSPDDAVVLLDALGVTLPAPVEGASFRPGELVDLLEGCDDLRAVAVHKTRRRYRGGGCLVELTTVRVGRAATDTVAVESEDPASVVALVERLGFPLRPNESMPCGLERLARLGAPRRAWR